MKRNEKTVKVKVKPKHLSRAERKTAKLAEKAAEQLELCRQAGEFHKAYLAIELGIEQDKFDQIQARLAELQPVTVETVETVTEEEIEPMESFEGIFAEETTEEEIVGE